jgi:hypothetical protein
MRELKSVLRFENADPDLHSFLSTGSGSRRAKITHKREEIPRFRVLDVLF